MLTTISESQTDGAVEGRLQRLVDRAGGIHTTRCPECGGKVTLSDGAPTLKPQYRYLLGCDDNQCLSACGPSVVWCVREWNRLCMQSTANKKGQA